MFNGKRLFAIQTGVGAFTPEARAQAAEDRLAKLARNSGAAIGPLTVAESDTGSDIDAGDIILFSVTDADARAAGKPRHALAAEYAAILEAALDGSSGGLGLRAIAEDIAISLLLTLLFALALKALQFAFERLRRLLESWRGTRIRDTRVQRLELLTAQRVVWVLTSATRTVHVCALLVATYVYISLLLSVFPATRPLSAALFAYVAGGLHAAAAAFAAYAPSLLMIVVAAVLTRLVIRICRYVFQGIEAGMLTVPGFSPEWSAPTYEIVRLLILAVAAVVIYPYIPGHDSPALKGVSIFFGVLLSLGSAGAVGNLVAGVLLTYTRAFQIGDRVRIADTEGDVTEKTLPATHIRTIKNEDITVPNSLVLSSHIIINYSTCCRHGALILHTSVTIGYDARWRQVHQLLIAAALDTPDVLVEPRPFVFQTALDDFYVSYQINAYTAKPRDMMRIYSDPHQNIQDKFNEAGMEICSPHFSALRDGNRIAVPESYVPKAYESSAFRVVSAAGGARTQGA